MLCEVCWPYWTPKKNAIEEVTAQASNATVAVLIISVPFFPYPEAGSLTNGGFTGDLKTFSDVNARMAHAQCAFIPIIGYVDASALSSSLQRESATRCAPCRQQRSTAAQSSAQVPSLPTFSLPSEDVKLVAVLVQHGGGVGGRRLGRHAAVLVQDQFDCLSRTQRTYACTHLRHARKQHAHTTHHAQRMLECGTQRTRSTMTQ